MRWAKMTTAQYRQMRRLLLFTHINQCTCACCGTPDNLHFHHINPATKVASIDKLLRTAKWEVIVEEARKCILLCEDCHIAYHKGELTHELSGGR